MNIFKRHLFWKILGVFWLTTFLTIIANVYITRQIADVERHYERIQTKLQDIAHDAVVVYESSGKKTLKQWYKNLYARHKIRVILLDENKQAIGKPVKRRRADNRGKPHGPGFIPAWRRQSFHPLAKQAVVAASGKKYVLKVLPSPFMHRAEASFHDYKLYRFLVSLIIICLGSFWLSRSVARPVKRLTKASERMAEGDLSVRVKDMVGQRSDELGELSNAFDHMAERTEALVSNQKQLLRDISHEIRTPLTRQQLAIELAKEEGGNLSFLEKIERQNHKLNELIDSLLTYSRLSDGSQSTQLETIDSIPLIESVCDAAELEAQNKSILIERKFASSSCFMGNWILAIRAVENILGNALKYSPEHSTISITTEVVDANLVIKVQDQGASINKEHLPHIFEPFYRVDESRSTTTGGYGLGLAIVDQIMKQHHGRIELENISPHGLLVTLFFPTDPLESQ